ncbi:MULTISPECIES: ORF6N domain-containing protein [unclassified Serratia (in: enterobacteria)]|uniref:ORF6N domain-containing protein n=1 Tax=unclassified Serratia (in: enterobacteria) TaxID=2647522 RepID=UPI0009E03A53|nr:MULTISPECIES: ORF6N domain-containing protein [unclassified Serratia (in: enterobacteria)]
MTNHTSVESLSVVTHNSIPVITTELLAQLYGTERQRVTNNFNRNKDRFIEGKHYFLTKGESLENLKNSLRGFHPIAPNVRKLILWTERGAARHAKMLETDQAWEVFEKLEDHYFVKPEVKRLRQPRKPAIDTKRFIGCFAAIETAWGQIHKDLLIIDPVAAREVGDLMDTVLRVGRTYQANSLLKLR